MRIRGIGVSAALAIGVALTVFGCLEPAEAIDDGTFRKQRGDLVRELKALGIRDARVLGAIGEVPRHEFVPAGIREWAYLNRPLPIGEEQTISQPYIVALMTELLAVRKGQRILEIGTGSGYQAAVLDHLGAEVYSIEIVPELAKRAAADLKRLGYDRVRVREGDGFVGWPSGEGGAEAFDAVIITCAIDRVPDPLIDQLKPGGRIVLPLGEELIYQDLTVVTKKKDGELEYRRVTGVVFVPMTGPHGHGKAEEK